MKTHRVADRQLQPGPDWATWEHFNELDPAAGDVGQMTAGSWIYIGSQARQGTYETFVEAGRQHYQGSLKGRWY